MNHYLAKLGIEQQHLDSCRLQPFEEAAVLKDAGVDVFDRPLSLTPDTLQHWLEMKSAAITVGVELQVVSGFRSIEYQCGLIEKKLLSGQRLDDILRVNAIPGYSEHHTGCAIDLTTPNCPPLEIDFELTDAFKWLSNNAADYGFSLSYPKGNSAGIDYEPWHWAFGQ